MNKLQMLRIAVCVVLFFLTAIQIYILLFGKRSKIAGFRRLLCYGVLFVAIFLIPSYVPASVVPDFLSGSTEKAKPSHLPDWLVYYNQTEEPWAKESYGPTDLIEVAGCGPTVLAMAVSSLTEQTVDPKMAADWAYENGYCSPGSGSYHTLIQEGLAHYGLESTVLTQKEEVKDALKNGYPVIALMGEGHFTGGGHFILLCQIDQADDVTVADPKSRENTGILWDLEAILSEAKVSPTTGGAFWRIDKRMY